MLLLLICSESTHSLFTRDSVFITATTGVCTIISNTTKRYVGFFIFQNANATSIIARAGMLAQLAGMNLNRMNQNQSQKNKK